MYNRARFIGRALASCLGQDDGDFEIVVVDDASSDGSPEVVRDVGDPRIRLICHETNRGVSPSRNTGLEVARGEWCVFLDSDDELLPGALARIRRRAVAASREVGALRFMCQDEAGRLSPDPPHPDEVLGYEDYLRWMERCVGGREEALPCVRRGTFPHVRYSDGHSDSEEALYHLDMARAVRVGLCSDVVRLYHMDADNRLTRPRPERSLRYAADGVRHAERVLARHGGALQTTAPTVFVRMLHTAMLYSFLAGNRASGLRYAARQLRAGHRLFRTVAIVLAGLLGPVPLAWIQAAWVRRLAMRRAVGGGQDSGSSPAVAMRDPRSSMQ
jgi:glycosyltransferase involved in cell wall biosynthesis